MVRGRGAKGEGEGRRRIVSFPTLSPHPLPICRHFFTHPSFLSTTLSAPGFSRMALTIPRILPYPGLGLGFGLGLHCGYGQVQGRGG